jgi:hypothetical protein
VLLHHSEYGVSSTNSAVWHWGGNALTASAFKVYFDKLTGAQIIFARVVFTWTPNAPGAPTSGVRLVHFDDGPANITEIIAFEDNDMTPIVSTQDITADLQALLAAGVVKQLGYQVHGDGSNSCTIYGALIEVVWG